MNVLVNALSAKLGGGQTYLTYLLRYVPDDAERIYVIASKAFAVPWNDKIKIIAVPDILENPSIRIIWESFILPFLIYRYKISIFFSPNGYCPNFKISPCQNVIVFQNMLPFWEGLNQNYKHFREQLRLFLLKKLFLRSIKTADRVIFISQYAKDFVYEKFNISAKESVVIHHGLDDKFRTFLSKSIPWPKAIAPHKRYFLYVSYFEPYKHQFEIISEFAQLSKAPLYSDVVLVLAGLNDNSYGTRCKELIKTLNLQSKVILLGNVPYSDLPNLYKHAALNIFASSCENCPNILLEKLGSGRPLVCLDIAPCRELAGDYACYFEFGETGGAFASAVLSALLISSCQFQITSWEDVAQRTWEFVGDMSLNSKLPA